MNATTWTSRIWMVALAGALVLVVMEFGWLSFSVRSVSKEMDGYRQRIEELEGQLELTTRQAA